MYYIVYFACIVSREHRAREYHIRPIFTFYQQVGNLSAHALQFARFKRKRLGASKYSNLIFERFIGVFRSFFLLTKNLLIYCIVGKTRKV
jgi:hypothetical protein